MTDTSHAGEPAGPAGQDLGFAVHVRDGGGTLVLSDRAFFGWLRVDRLELEIPNVAFPLDVAGGAARFQRRRCRVARAVLSVDDRALETLVWSRAAQLGGAGFDEVRLRLLEGVLELSARVRTGDRSAELTARAYVEGADRGLRLSAGEVRLFGLLRRPAPLVLHDLLCALTGATAGEAGEGASARVRGLCDVEVSALDAFLWHALPPSGWRLPDVAGVRLKQVRITRGRAEVELAPGEPGPPAARSRRAAAQLSPAAELRAGDERLLRGDLDGAVAAYRAELSRRGPDPAVVERLLAILAAQGGERREAIDGAEAPPTSAGSAGRGRSLAEELARDALSRWPDFVPGTLTLAALAVERGRAGEAAEHFGRALELAEAAGDDEEAVRAALAAARQLRDSDARRATTCYERVLDRRPGHVEACEALAERYSADERWPDLVRLLRRRIAATSDRREQAREHVRLGEVLLGRLRDAERAREELERATRLAETDARAWDGLGRALATLGDSAAAIAALERVVDLLAAKGDALGEARAHARIGALSEILADDETALARYRRALELQPQDLDTLERMAAVAARRQRGDDAVAAYERLAELAGDDEERRRRAEREVGRLLLQAGELERARRFLAPAGARDDADPDRLALLAALEERAGRLPAAAEALGRAAALAGGARGAELELKRARLLEGLGEPAEAAAALERAVTLAPESAAGQEAARALVMAARRAGDAAAETRWLDAILAAEAEAHDRGDLALRRAELAAEAGDLATARRLADEALRSSTEAARARHTLAGILGRLGDHAGCAALLEAAAAEERAPARAASVWALAAEARLAAGEPDAALEAARRAAALAPDEGAVRRALGEAAWRTRAWDDLLTAYAPLLAETAGHDRAEVGRRLGTALERKGSDREAAAAYRAAVDAAEATGDAVAVSYRRLAELHERLGEPGEAAAALAAAAADPRTGEPLAARAEQRYRAAEILRKRLGATDRAVAELEEALRVDHEHMPALDALEAIHTDAKDHDRVAAILGRKIAATARHPERQKALLCRLAELQHRALGRGDVAREAYRRALEIDPTFRPALRFLAADARERGDTVEARRVDELLAAEPTSPAEDGVDVAEERVDAIARLAELALAEERRDDAERLLSAALALRPERQDLLMRLEELYAHAGRFGDVVSVLARRIAAASDAPARIALEARRVSVLAEHTGDPAGALEACRAALARAPDDLRLLTLMAATARVCDRPQELAAAQERLAGLVADPAVRRAALWEAAELYRVRLGQAARAQALYEEILAQDERDDAALGALGELARARGDRADFDALLGRRMALESDAARRGELALERARVLLEEDDVDGALGALADVPADAAGVDLLLCRADLLEEHADWRGAAGDLAAVRQRAEADGDPALERRVCRRLAALTLERLRHEVDAERLYQRALAIDPDDLAAADALASIQERRRDPAATIAALERVLEIARRTGAGPAREVEVLGELARRARAARDLTGARARLDEACALSRDPALLRERAEVAAALSDFADCARWLESLAAATSPRDDEERTELGELLLELAEVRERGQKDWAGARDALRRAAEVYPEGSRRDALLRRWSSYAAEAGEDAEAARALELLGPGSRTGSDMVALSRCYSRLGRDADAIRALAGAEALGGLDSDDALALFALYRKSDRARELAAALERSAARADAVTAQHRLREALGLYENTLGDGEGAARVRAALAALAPPPPPAQAAAPPPELGAPSAPELLAYARAAADPAEAHDLCRRAAAAFGEGEGWGEAMRLAAGRARDLGDPAREEADLLALAAEGAAAVPELGRLAELLEEREALEDATNVLSEAVCAHARDLAGRGRPLDDDGRALLLRLRAAGRATHAFQPLAEGLLAAAAAEPDATTAATWLTEVAAIRRAHLGDAHGAADALARALALRPDDTSIVADLDALLRELGDFARLIDVYDLHLRTLQDAARAPVLHELGRVWAEAFGEPARAATYFAQAHVCDPEFAPVLLPLGDFHYAENELDPAEDYYRAALAAGGVAPAEQASVLARLGELALKRGDAHEAVAQLREALEVDPLFTAAWSWLEHALRAADDWDALVELLLARAREEQDREERLVHLREVAALLDGPLGRSEDATAVYEEILRLDPADELAQARAQAASAAARSAEGDTVSGEIVGKPAARHDFLELKAGEEMEAQGKTESAIAHYENAWAEAPHDPRPLAALYRIAEQRGDHEYVAELLGRQILLAADAPARARLWMVRARLYRDVLHRDAEAYRCLREACANDPTLSEASHALRALAVARSEWALVAELLYREIEAAADPVEKAALHVELALILEERLLDLAGAIRNYETARALDRDGPVPPVALARLYALCGHHAEAAVAEEEAARRERDPAARAERLLRAAEHAERAEARTQAERLYREAAEVAGGGDAAAAAMAKLSRLAGAGTDPEAARKLLEARLAETQEPAERLTLLRRLLNAAMAAGVDDECDVRAREVLARDPADLTAFLERRRLAAAHEDWVGLAELYRARAEAIDDVEERAGLYFELGRLCARRLGDQARAALAFEEALRADPRHGAALDALADIAYRQHDWERARGLYARLDVDASSMGRDVVCYRRGELAEVMGNEAEAEAAYREAIAANPSHLSALEALARLALYRGEITAAIDALRGVLDLLPLDDVDRITNLRQQLGELCQRAGDASAARSYFELVLAEDPTRVAALMPLAELYASAGAWPRAAEMLGRLAMLVASAEKRADLLFRMGEIYRIHLGDEDRASDAYLKAIDLDPHHVPTMRRLIDYYWSVDDPGSLAELAADLQAHGGLVAEDTTAETLARVALSAALAGDTARAAAVARALGPAGAGALAATLAAAAARSAGRENELVTAARMLCVEPGPTLEAVKAVLAMRGPKDPAAALLASRL